MERGRIAPGCKSFCGIFCGSFCGILSINDILLALPSSPILVEKIQSSNAGIHILQAHPYYIFRIKCVTLGKQVIFLSFILIFKFQEMKYESLVYQGKLYPKTFLKVVKKMKPKLIFNNNNNYNNNNNNILQAFFSKLSYFWVKISLCVTKNRPEPYSFFCFISKLNCCCYCCYCFGVVNVQLLLKMLIFSNTESSASNVQFSTRGHSSIFNEIKFLNNVEQICTVWHVLYNSS